jgi:hypothetical protein
MVVFLVSHGNKTKDDSVDLCVHPVLQHNKMNTVIKYHDSVVVYVFHKTSHLLQVLYMNRSDKNSTC